MTTASPFEPTAASQEVYETAPPRFMDNTQADIQNNPMVSDCPDSFWILFAGDLFIV